MIAKHFRVRSSGGEVLTEGVEQCALGTPVPAAKGDVPDGIFAQWNWDGERLTMRNDRYGIYPLFYYVQDSRGIAVSSSLVRLVELGAPTDLDYEALAVFIRFGSFLGEDTPFKHIGVLPPGSTAVWDRGKFSVSARGITCGPLQTLSLDEAAHEYQSLFAKAVRKRLPRSERFVVPISGGQDSKHILLELCRLGCKPRYCVTSGYFSSVATRDIERAVMLARALGVEHRILEQRGSEYRAEIEKNVRTHFLSLEHGWFLPVAEFLRKEADTSYDGLGGDTLSAGMRSTFITEKRLKLHLAGDFSALADDVLNRVEMDRYLIPDVSKKLSREIAIARLERELRRHGGAPNPYVSFLFWNRTRRSVAVSPYGICDETPVIYTPYLDHDLFDFLSGLPSSMCQSFNLHRETLKRAYPELEKAGLLSLMEPSAFPARGNRRFAVEVMTRLLRDRFPAYVRYERVAPKLALCAVSGEYALKNHWFLGLMTYLVQLQSIAERKW
jgi:asparagine synthase (glutamine-hydrolysing)